MAELAAWLGLSGWLAMNAYGMRDGLQATPAVLEDTLEALLGALYLDAGADAAEAFIRRSIGGWVRWEELGAMAVDFKGRLARLAAAERLPRPAYSVLAHDKAAYPNTELRVRRGRGARGAAGRAAGCRRLQPLLQGPLPGPHLPVPRLFLPAADLLGAGGAVWRQREHRGGQGVGLWAAAGGAGRRARGARGAGAPAGGGLSCSCLPPSFVYLWT